MVWAVATVVDLAGWVHRDLGIRFGPDFRAKRQLRRGSRTMFLDDARRAFRKGAPERLDAFLKRLNDYTESEHFSPTAGASTWSPARIDRHCGCSGPSAYRSPLDAVLAADRNDGPNSPLARRPISPDHRGAATAHFDPWESLWYFLWLPLLIAVLCYVLAVHLASPLRNLRRVVERFGRGELGATVRALAAKTRSASWRRRST